MSASLFLEGLPARGSTGACEEANNAGPTAVDMLMKSDADIFGQDS